MRHILVVVFVILSAAFTRADDQLVFAWWSGLTLEQQIEVQTDLVLTGHYDALVDAELGPATLRALRSFQSGIGRAPSGVLASSERRQLRSAAAKVFSRLGMVLVEDEETGLSTFVPMELVRKVDSSEGATNYRSNDDELAFLLLGGPSEGASVEGVRDFLIEPKAGRTVSYSSIKSDRVVVSGVEDGVRFYTLLTVDERRLFGYSVTWTATYDHVGQMLAVLAASYTFPLEPNAEPAPQPKASPDHRRFDSEGERIGPFLLPASSPETIVLDDEIRENAALDFIRALRKRPSATTLSLNSPGGYVGTALVIAHETRQRGLKTSIGEGYGCYSACAYVFLAGSERDARGELGVHQVYGDSATVATAQATLSDVLDALAEFGVDQEVISVMLRTPPDQMYVFSQKELKELGIDRAGPSQGRVKTVVEGREPSLDTQVAVSGAAELIPLIKSCMRLPNGAQEARSIAKLQVEIEAGRIVSGPRSLVAPTNDLETQMMIAGMRAIDECSPYPSHLSGLVNITFDPNE